MSSKDFLDRMRKAGEKYSGGTGAGIIGRVLIETGLHRYVTGHEFWSFWKPVLDEKEIDTIGSELSKRLQEAGCTDEPTFGIKITIKADVLSKTEPYKADLQEFIPAWQEDAFNLICDAIEKANLPVGEIFFGQVQYKANPFHVKKGNAGKTEIDQNGKARFPSIRLPVEKFANEAEARAAAGGSSGASASASTSSQWSDTLRSNYPDLATFDLNIANIQVGWDKIVENELPWKDAPALPQPSTTPNLKRYLAGLFDCASEDIDIVINMTPF